MSEQQYRVIADRDKGDDMTVFTQQGDRLTWEWTDKHMFEGLRHNELVRIERPVPTTDEDLPPRVDWKRFDREVLGEAFPPTPTRGQIAEVIGRQVLMSTRDRKVQRATDAVLALIQNGADR